MAIGKFLKTGGMAALAAGLVLASATAASAQDGRPGWRGGDRGGQSQGGNGGGGRGGWNGGENRGGGEWRGRQPQQSQPQQAAPQAVVSGQAAPEARRGWQGNGGQRNWNGQRNWRADNARQVEVPNNGVEQRQMQAREAQARDGGWQGRNRSYVDPNRNSSYRSADRNGWRGDDRRNDTPAWRGNDNRRWDNDRRDGDRYEGRRAPAWEGNRYAGNRWNSSWRNDNRYNWQSYRNSNRNIYRIGRYYAPYRNYYYRPLSIGFYLDSGFYGSSYWLDDPWEYRLPPAEGPYRWVRYYDDVLLVDIYSGEVVDVIHDFFW